jgi:hypothetical protein
LKRNWIVEGKTVDLYEEIMSGRKTSEWRETSIFWLRRLLTKRLTLEGLSKVLDTHKHGIQNLTPLLRVHTAWFVVGYPRGNVPRLEADITGLLYHLDSRQLETQFTNVRETVPKLFPPPCSMGELIHNQKYGFETEK